MQQGFEIRFMAMDVYRAARELVRRVHAAKIRHAELRDQAERASVSTLLALAEGLPHDSAAMRRTFFSRAKASVGEVAGSVDTAAALEAIALAEASAIIALAGRVRAMIVGLLRPVSGRGR